MSSSSSSSTSSPSSSSSEAASTSDYSSGSSSSSSEGSSSSVTEPPPVQARREKQKAAKENLTDTPSASSSTSISTSPPASSSSSQKKTPKKKMNKKDASTKQRGDSKEKKAKPPAAKKEKKKTAERELGSAPLSDSTSSSSSSAASDVDVDDAPPDTTAAGLPVPPSRDGRFTKWAATLPRWLQIVLIILRVILGLGLLYVFLVGLALLGDAFKLFGSKAANSMVESVTNPVAGVVVGILATVLVQSSSTTTSIVVALVAGETIPVRIAIPIVMGANVGTSVTNTLVSLAHVIRTHEFEYAFAGATVHDFFNLLSLAIMLPIEIATTVLLWSSNGIADGLVGADVESFDSPVKAIVSPTAKLFVGLNKTALKEDDSENFIEKGMFKDADIAAWGVGIILLFISLFLLCGALALMVKVLQTFLTDKVTIWLETVMTGERSKTWWFSTASILLGVGLTIAVQSSSVVTSSLTPLAAIRVITLEQMFPMTLGSNVGTTVTAIVAAVSTGTHDGIQIAIAHFLFNIIGILIWFPAPFMRKVPLWCARNLGHQAGRRRWVAAVYVALAFFLIPLGIYGLSLTHPAVFWTFFTLFMLAFIFAFFVVFLRISRTYKAERLVNVQCLQGPLRFFLRQRTIDRIREKAQARREGRGEPDHDLFDTEYISCDSEEDDRDPSTSTTNPAPAHDSSDSDDAASSSSTSSSSSSTSASDSPADDDGDAVSASSSSGSSSSSSYTSSTSDDDDDDDDDDEAGSSSSSGGSSSDSDSDSDSSAPSASSSSSSSSAE